MSGGRAGGKSMIEINTKTLGSRVDLQYVGTYYEVRPVPLSGKIMFRDIGNLAVDGHTGAMDVDLTDPAVLQMIGEKNPIKPVDPKDFRGAIWGQGTKIDFTDYQPPPPPDTWFAAFLNTFPGDTSSVTYDASEDALLLIADVRDEYQQNWGKRNESAAIYYVGRFPAGTKLKASVKLKARNDDTYGAEIVANIRGWKEGWFGGDESYHTYRSFSRNSSRFNDDYQLYEQTFTVLAGWEDVWVTCEVLSNDPRYANGHEKNRGWYKDYRISLA